MIIGITLITFTFLIYIISLEMINKFYLLFWFLALNSSCIFSQEIFYNNFNSDNDIIMEESEIMEFQQFPLIFLDSFDLGKLHGYQLIRACDSLIKRLSEYDERLASYFNEEGPQTKIFILGKIANPRTNVVNYILHVENLYSNYEYSQEIIAYNFNRGLLCSAISLAEVIETGGDKSILSSKISKNSSSIELVYTYRFISHDDHLAPPKLNKKTIIISSNGKINMTD